MREVPPSLSPENSPSYQNQRQWQENVVESSRQSWLPISLVLMTLVAVVWWRVCSSLPA